jgi:cell shape-determining protein MreC
MNYHYDRDKKNKRAGYLFGSVFLMLVLFTPIYGIFFGFFQNYIVQTWKNEQDLYAGTNNFFQAFASKQIILEKNKQLQQEIDRLHVDNLRTQYLADTLDSTLFFDNENNILGAIIDYGSLGSYDHVMINRGQLQNVNIGDRVFIAENVLIGYISETYSATARVKLYSDDESRVNGILHPHNETLTAIGNGGGSFIIETPREIEVTAGDIFYSLAEPGNIIAIVKYVEFDARDPFKTVYLTYPINLKQHHIVEIKKNLNQSE